MFPCQETMQPYTCSMDHDRGQDMGVAQSVVAEESVLVEELKLESG